MGSSKEEEEEAEAIISRRKQLPLLSIQLAGGISRHDFEYSPEEHESGMLTPPLYTSASVPFRWEEEPGKPRPCTALITSTSTSTTTVSADNIIISKGLELPPRLQLVVTASNDKKMTKMPSPTTVLDGPYYNLPLLQSSSFRFSTSRRRRKGGSFGSSSCGSPDQRGGHFGNSIVPMSKKGLLDEQQRKGSWRSPGGGGGLFGSWRRKSHKRGNKSSSVDVGEGSFVFSSSPVEVLLAGLDDDDDLDLDLESGGAKVSSKITSATRNSGSFSSLSQVRSHFWATIYKGFKQVLPLKSTRSKKDGLPV